MKVQIQVGRRKQQDLKPARYEASNQKELMDKIPIDQRSLVEKAMDMYWKDVALNGHKSTDTMAYPLHSDGKRVTVSVQGERGIGYWGRFKEQPKERHSTYAW
ncbi:MAG: hypothetical protein HY513_05860 [Candidatus Aenigmarchaeota archaeon]|nr:hypothetical protein [Candidatus Aenigmarchaeota archaeon]